MNTRWSVAENAFALDDCTVRREHRDAIARGDAHGAQRAGSARRGIERIAPGRRSAAEDSRDRIALAPARRVANGADVAEVLLGDGGFTHDAPPA